MYISTTNSVEPITLAAVLAGRLRDRRLIDGPARLAVGAARRPDADADEDGFLLCAFLLLRLFGGGRHGSDAVLWRPLLAARRLVVGGAVWAAAAACDDRCSACGAAPSRRRYAAYSAQRERMEIGSLVEADSKAVLLLCPPLRLVSTDARVQSGAKSSIQQRLASVLQPLGCKQGPVSLAQASAGVLWRPLAGPRLRTAALRGRVRLCVRSAIEAKPSLCDCTDAHTYGVGR